MQDELTATTTETETIEPGQHTATVTSLAKQPTENDEYPPYLQFELDVDGADTTLQFGLAWNQEGITNKSQLGRLITAVQGDFPDGEVNLAEIFDGVELEITVVEDDEGFPKVVKEVDNELQIKPV